MKHGTCPVCGNPLYFEQGNNLSWNQFNEPPTVDFWYCDHCDYESIDDPTERAVCMAEAKWDDEHGH